MSVIAERLGQYGVGAEAAQLLSSVVLVFVVLLVSAVAYLVTRLAVLRWLAYYIRTNKVQWDGVLLDRGVLHRLSHLVPATVIYWSASAFEGYAELVTKLALSYTITATLFALLAILDSVDDLYRTLEIARTRPIRGYVQIAKIAVVIVGAAAVIATMVGQSPLIILSGLGALSAVLLLVFKDTLLGLMAGIQLSTNDMVRIGDWIEIPKYGADGDVIDISLHVVKVRNWDKTITTIPTYALISDSFKNWRGMQDAGGRRIKRSVHIDISSVAFCTDEMIQRFRRMHYLTEYIDSKLREISEYNEEHGVDPTELVNGRRLTNIGTFRAYVKNYINKHPGIHKGMIQMVRQLAPGEHGIPIEIYCFTSDTNWINYENIQSDIFDHILAVVPHFGLRVFQDPTGSDMRSGLSGRTRESLG